MKLILFFFFLSISYIYYFFFFFSSRRRHTRWNCDWSSDVCSSDLRNPTIVVSIFSHVPDAWEVHVGERDQVAVFRCISKNSFPPNRGELLVNVEFDRDRRGIELHVRSVNRVAQENQLFTAVLERVKR